jgi:O-antigen/teichoic acid export membrane protein
MAQKFVLQVRQLVVAPTSILMPAFAHIKDCVPKELSTLYRKSLAAAIVVGSLIMGASAIVSPVVSILWLGHIERLFVIFVTILSVGWLVNIVASPVYVLTISVGLVKWNFWSAVITVTGSPLLALTIGQRFGPIGVVSATVLALAVGSLFNMIMNCRYAAMPVWTRLSDLRDFIIFDLIRLFPFSVGGRKSLSVGGDNL